MTNDIEKDCDTCHWWYLLMTEKPCSYCNNEYDEWTP